MHKIYEVFGLLEDERDAQETVRDLTEHGVPPDKIEVIVPEAGAYVLADEHLHEDIVGAEHGALLGGMVGLLAGFLAALVMPGFDGVGTPALLLALGFGGFGATIGAVSGMMLRDAGDDDEVRTRSVLAPSAARVVAVRSDVRVGRAHKILEKHGALFLDDVAPTRQ